MTILKGQSIKIWTSHTNGANLKGQLALFVEATTVKVANPHRIGWGLHVSSLFNI